VITLSVYHVQWTRSLFISGLHGISAAELWVRWHHSSSCCCGIRFCTLHMARGTLQLTITVMQWLLVQYCMPCTSATGNKHQPLTHAGS
jgi:hypothetical protein